MDINLTTTLVGSGLLLLGGILGYYIQYFLNKKQEIISKNNEIKRENYKKFVSLVVDIVAGGKVSKKNADERQKEYLKKIYDFYKDYLLYASPNVINAFANWMQFIFEGKKETTEHFLLLSNIIKQMREELGLSNKALGKSGEVVFKALLSDYYKFFDK